MPTFRRSDKIPKIIALNTALARSLGTNAAVMLCQCIFWTKVSRDKGKQGWFWHLQSAWFEETGLSRREQETARKKLRGLALISEGRYGNPRRLLFRANLQRIDAFIEQHERQREEEIARAEQAQIDAMTEILPVEDEDETPFVGNSNPHGLQVLDWDESELEGIDEFENTPPEVENGDEGMDAEHGERSESGEL